MPAVEPVHAFLHRRDERVDAARLLGELGVELGDPGAQVLELGPLVVGDRRRGDAHRRSAILGASRANAQPPSATAAAITASGMSSRGAPPIASQTGVAVGSTTAWRISVSRLAIGLARYARCQFSGTIVAT